MKTLVTGGAGFIGSHLVEKLLENGDEVFALDDLSTGSLKNINHLSKNPNFHFQKGDVLDLKIVDEMVKKADRVFHLAAVVGVKKVVENPLKTLEVNLTGTENVLKAATKYQPMKKVLITSSSEVYGKNQKTPFFETDDSILVSSEDARGNYAFAKAINERLALAYFSEKKLPIVVVRFSNISGSRQSPDYGMVLPKFVRNALLGEPIEVFGDGKQTRSFCHVLDAVAATAFLMSDKKAEGKIFNIGGEEELTLNQLAEKVKKITKSKSEITHLPFAKTYSPTSNVFQKRKLALSRLRQLFKFKPRSVEEIIFDLIIDYYRGKK